MAYETHQLSLIVKPAGEPIFSEMATTIRIEDDAGGPFIEVEQHGNGLGKIAIDPDEWEEIRNAIDQMVAACGRIGG